MLNETDTFSPLRSWGRNKARMAWAQQALKLEWQAGARVLRNVWATEGGFPPLIIIIFLIFIVIQLQLYVFSPHPYPPLILKSLFIFRKRGREWERQKHRCARGTLITFLLHNDSRRPGPEPRHAPQLGIERATFWFTEQYSTHWITNSQGCRASFVIHLKSNDKPWKYFKQAGEQSEERVELEWILE